MKQYSAIKKNAGLVCAMVWLNLKNTKLIEEINLKSVYYVI